MLKNNSGFNQWIPAITPPWPGHHVRLYHQIGKQNRRREEQLTEEQAIQYFRMKSYWLERDQYYRDSTNYEDDLCLVMACRDTLNVVTSNRGEND